MYWFQTKLYMNRPSLPWPSAALSHQLSSSCSTNCVLVFSTRSFPNLAYHHLDLLGFPLPLARCSSVNYFPQLSGFRSHFPIITFKDSISFVFLNWLNLFSCPGVFGSDDDDHQVPDAKQCPTILKAVKLFKKKNICISHDYHQIFYTVLVSW